MKKISDKKRIMLSLALGACLLATGACAANSAPPTPQLQTKFEAMDTSGDGKVVLEEFTAALPNMNAQAFTIIDKNGDKGIDSAEWIEFVQNHGKSPNRMQAPKLNNIPGDPMIPPPDSSDLPLVRPPAN